MNLRKVFLALVLMAFAFTERATAQTVHTCASDEINDAMLENNPVFYMGMMQFEQSVQARQSVPVEERSDDIYTLPVVVHIIHKGEAYGLGSNITDEQIFSAITALNNDFRHVAGTNGFGDGPDVGIEFCLAVRDPNGQPTTGINRIDGRVVPLYEEQGIAASGSNGASETAVKALSTWPRESYINIWVVTEIENNNGGSGIQGYAYFPVSSPVDGIVLLYNAFGTVGTLKSYTNLNRTLTHEIGHYFSLYHTFHMTTACGSESNCNTAGDKVCDTPPTTQNSSCSSPACSGTQQVENYLDYTGQVCQNQFTEGQKLRMRTALETQRTSMLSSMGCMPVNNRDAGVTAVLSPNGSVCPGSLQPTVTLTNFGSNTLTSVTINYNVNGVGSQTQSWTGSLVSGASSVVTLNAITPPAGENTLYVWTSMPNGASDQNASNDQSTGVFNAASGGVATLIVRLDYFGSETTWNIKDESNNLLMNGGPYADYQQGTEHTHNVCLPPGCYTLTFNDTHNDGQGFTNGNFRLLDSQGDTLVYQTGNWGQSSINPFCLVASTVPPVASMTIADNTICRNTTTNFNSTSTGSPTSFSWTFEGGSPATSEAQNPQNISYANAGTYDVTLTVSNANGSHTYTCSNCVTVYSQPTVTLSGTNPACNNAATGSVNSTVSGGASPYTYAWSNSASTAQLTGVAAGSYTLTATDANGCSNQASTTLTNPSAIAITGTVNNATCATGNNGSITAAATGGTGLKTYIWSNGATGATASGLAAGSYTVTVEDAAGCTRTQSFNVTAPSSIVITATVNNTTCAGGNNGSITATSTGGTGSKTYTWSNGATGATASNLIAGSYTVTATDANNCSATQSFVVSSPSSIVITGTVVNGDCNSGNLGSISVSATGGTGSKTFSWSNGSAGSTISNLTAGVYNVTATDANNCTSTQSFTVSGSTSMSITGVASNVSCAGASNGVITVNVTGGTGVVTYSWSNGSTNSTISNLAAGTYTITAEDATGCTIVQQYTITAPAPVVPNVNSLNITCNGNTGSAQVNPTGGMSPYQVAWSNGATGTSVSGLSAGTYSVTVTDAFNCAGQATFTITQSESLSLSIAATQVSCNGASNGTATVTAQGGNGSYTYLWSNGATGSTIGSLTPGTYGVLVTDGNGCQGSEEVIITQPETLSITSDILDVSCFGSSNGAISISISGGVGPYQYEWSNGNTSDDIDNLSSGNYSITVTDANNCTAQSTYTVSEPEMLMANIIVINGESCDGNDGAAEVIPSGGNAGYNIYWNNGSVGSVLEDVAAGEYSVTIIDTEGCSIFTNVVIPYDCETVVAQTQLIPSNCDAIDLPVDALIYCVEVENAEMYQWRFATEQGIIISDEYSLGNVFYVSQIPMVESGTKYYITVKALVDGTWGQFGASCSITTEGEPVVVIPGLSNESCGVVITDWGQTLIAFEVPNVVSYQWHIIGNNYDWTTYTTINALVVEEAMQLVAGEVYYVKMRCSLGQGEFTDWGPNCTISVDMAIDVASFPPIDGILHFYPNPNDGERIIFDFGNLPQGSVVEDLVIYSAAGSIVEQIKSGFGPGNGNTYEYYFKNKLASGMYVLRYKFNGRDSEEKLLVR